MACALGGPCLAAAYVTARHPNRARVAAVASSAAMGSWIVAQVATIGYRSSLQPLVAATGLTVTRDMWNSNSVTAWLLASRNRPATGRRAGGRAGPGMDRGLRS